MWLTTPSANAITRPRIFVAVLSAVAAASAGYYLYSSHNGWLPLQQRQQEQQQEGGGLHRSNAVRRSRRPRRSTAASTSSSFTSDAEVDENADVSMLRPLADGETVVEDDLEDWWNDTTGFPISQRAGHNIVTLLFRVSEDNARRNGCVHRGCQCNGCGMLPIRGVRYRCTNCADFDLCETCEAQGIHYKTHTFYKIRVPAPPFGPRHMQPVWYTGDPDSCRRTLPRALIAKLSRDTGFERPDLEAFWEQWTFMANTEWRNDPDELCVAMDRKTFERCLIPGGGSPNAAPNLVHDRMFSFYDTNNDDLIGFREFLEGLSYRERKDKLRKVFEGYDLDGDGFVERQDFLRVFRAYYMLYRQMHRDMVDGLEDQVLAGTEVEQLVTGRQPLSSFFGREGRVPQAEVRPALPGKEYHANGDVDIVDDQPAPTIENRDDTATREEVLTNLFAYDENSAVQNSLFDEDRRRTIRERTGIDLERAYWVTLIEPPSTLDELGNVLMENNLPLHYSDPDIDGGDPSTRGPFADARTESERRSRLLEHNRKQASLVEKKHRAKVRDVLRDRWKKRQFYLDEEEGGKAPEGWDEKDDVLARHDPTSAEFKDTNGKGSGSTSTPGSTSTSDLLSEASGGLDDAQYHPKESISTQTAPERSSHSLPAKAELDAGIEILYQVSQQAFNEMLDAFFDNIETLALEAAETKTQRAKYRHRLDMIDGVEEDGDRPKYTWGLDEDGMPIFERSLDELLAESGYTVEGHETKGPTEAGESTTQGNQSQTHNGGKSTKIPTLSNGHVDHHDPTMPQFKPNSDAFNEFYARLKAEDNGASVGQDWTTDDDDDDWEEELDEVDVKTLTRWRLIDKAEKHAQERGGWGRLSYREFEEEYENQKQQGNRLDYLGSWIDFCIP